MKLEFDHRFALPAEEVFSYFRTPRDWTRLFGLAGEVEETPDGWTRVPLHRFPFPLVARNVEVEPPHRARWVFRGFWRGEGAVRISQADGGVRVRGYEEIAVRWLGPLSWLVEKAYLEKGFRAVWEMGWRRLRKAEAERASAA